jgi:xylulose-5-phosphate/fructose-6-phosphate phosphoketolase
MHVRGCGYKEEGATTTPFDMTVLNEIDRLHLALDVIHRVPKLGKAAARQERFLHNRLIEHKLYIAEYGDDMPEIREWKWPG